MRPFVSLAISGVRRISPRQVRAWRHARRQRARFCEALRANDVFLVGHPKSGNTWLAYMLAIVLREDVSGRINLANVGGYVPTVHAADRRIGEFGSLPGPRVFRNEGPVYPRLYPKTIYLVRDPRAAWVSYYHHCRHDLQQDDWPLSEFLDEMLAHGGIQRLEPHLIRWDRQVEFWLRRARRQPVHFVRYEDLISDRRTALQDVLRFIGVPAADSLLDLAERRGAFDSMRREELIHGAESFPGEKGSRGFFIRKGRVDGWREELTPELVGRIEDALGSTMVRIGYRLDRDSPPRPLQVSARPARRSGPAAPRNA